VGRTQERAISEEIGELTIPLEKSGCTRKKGNHETWKGAVYYKTVGEKIAIGQKRVLEVVR